MTESTATPQPPGPVTFRVNAVPATFATAREKEWRAAVDLAATKAMSNWGPFPGGVGVDIEFVLPERMGRHPGWDLDNLIKPTIDAMSAIIGVRAGAWVSPQVDDERVREIRARKRTAVAPETPHVIIAVWSIEDVQEPGGQHDVEL